MSDRLSKSDVVTLTERLTAVFDKPFGARTETVVEEWFKVLRWLPASAVTTAVDRWIASKYRMPNPAQIAATVRETAAGASRHHDHTVVSGCQQCGTDDVLRPVPRRALSTPEDVVWLERGICDCQFRAQVRTWNTEFLVHDDPIVTAERGRRATR